MSRSSKELLTESLTHLRLAAAYAAEAKLSPVVIDAVSMRLSAGIEVLARLDAPVRERLFGVDWQLMWGMRNRIAHGYLLVDAAIIRQTVDSDLPVMISVIERELRRI